MFKKKHFPIRNVKRLKLEKSEAANLLPPSWLFTFSKLTIETIEQGVEYVQS